MKATVFLLSLKREGGTLSQESGIHNRFISQIFRATNDDAALEDGQRTTVADRIQLESLHNPNDDLEKLRVAMSIAQYINSCR